MASVGKLDQIEVADCAEWDQTVTRDGELPPEYSTSLDAYILAQIVPWGNAEAHARYMDTLNL